METGLESTSRQPAAEHLNESARVELSKQAAGEACRSCLKIYSCILKGKGQPRVRQRTSKQDYT